MFEPVYIVGFSGNRPNDEAGRSAEAIEALRPHVLESFERFKATVASSGGRIELFSGAAEGADTVACEAAMESGIPIHVVLPKQEAAFRRDFDDPPAWARVERIIAHARSGENGSTFRVAAVRGSGSSCYEVANALILEAADFMLLLWNGRMTDKAGGTGAVLGQAKALGIPHIILNTRRPEQPEEAGLDRFAAEPLQRKEDGLYKKLSHLCPDAKSFKSVWARLEEAASQSSSFFRASMTTSILFHGGGALVAGVAVSYALKMEGGYALAMLSGVELLMVSFALAIMLWHARRHTRDTWIQSRFASELMRGIDSSSGIVDPLFPNVQYHLSEWRLFARTACLQAHRDRSKEPLDLPKLRERYVTRRIQDQRDYYLKQYRKAAPKSDFFGRIGEWTSWGALFFVLIAFAFKLAEPLTGWVSATYADAPKVSLFAKQCVVYFLPVALPLIAGISNSLATSLDISRRRHRYEPMARRFEREKSYILMIEDPQVLEQTVRRLEEILLDEQIEWMGAAMTGSAH